MSNVLTLSCGAAAFVIATGSKKAPVKLLAPRVGVALANGKNGTEARRAEKADMPTQALNGGFHTFAGFLMATFPKAAAQYEARVAAQRKVYEDAMADPDMAAHAEAKLAELNKAASPTNRTGFDVLIQCIVTWADQTATKPPKLTKAMEDAMSLLVKYVQGRAAQVEAARAARQAAQAPNATVAETVAFPAIEAFAACEAAPV